MERAHGVRLAIMPSVDVLRTASFVLAVAAALLPLLAGCGDDAPAATGTVRIEASFYPLAWMAEQGMRSYEMTEIVHRGLSTCLTEAFEIAMDDCDGVFLSVDIDVCDPGHAPGTGTPESGGLSARELLDAVRRIAIAVALSRGLLSIAHPDWRLLDLSTPACERVRRLVVAIAIIVSAMKIADALVDLTAASVAVAVLLLAACASKEPAAPAREPDPPPPPTPTGTTTTTTSSTTSHASVDDDWRCTVSARRRIAGPPRRPRRPHRDRRRRRRRFTTTTATTT